MNLYELQNYVLCFVRIKNWFYTKLIIMHLELITEYNI